MTAFDRVVAAIAFAAGALLLVDVVVITVLDDSFGTFDNLLWSGFVLLAPVALLLAPVVLTRGMRRRWLAVPLVFVLLLAVMGALGALADAAVREWYDGENRGVTWEAANYVFAVLLLCLGVLVVRRAQRPVRSSPES